MQWLDRAYIVSQGHSTGCTLYHKAILFQEVSRAPQIKFHVCICLLLTDCQFIFILYLHLLYYFTDSTVSPQPLATTNISSFRAFKLNYSFSPTKSTNKIWSTQIPWLRLWLWLKYYNHYIKVTRHVNQFNFYLTLRLVPQYIHSSIIRTGNIQNLISQSDNTRIITLKLPGM